MAIIKWAVKELLTAIKMNNFGIRRASVSEQVATLDIERLSGDNYFNTDHKAPEIYQSGSGGTFKVTQLSNFIVRQEGSVGIAGTEKTILEEQVPNMRGISNTKIFATLKYLAEPNQAGSVKLTVTDGVTPVTDTAAFSSNPAPVDVYERLEVDTSSFTIDDILTIKILGTQVNISHIEIRSL